MKSSQSELANRGYIDEKYIKKYTHLSNLDLLIMLESHYPQERTSAVCILRERGFVDNLEFVELLLEMLYKENKLYTKLEITKTLETGNKKVIKEMIKHLGKIGKNQYTILPNSVSKKKSFPLPRDIIARTLGKIDSSYLVLLFNEFEKLDILEQRELIDAIGYLIFYNKDLQIEKNFLKILSILENTKDEIIFWKSIIVLSAFDCDGCKEKLNKIIKTEKKNILKQEAKRSLDIVASYGNYEKGKK